MEILQTIWTAITNENEMIVNIMSVPLTFVEVYIVSLLYSAILNIELSKKKRIIFVSSLSLASLINQFIVPTPYNVFINLLFTLIIGFLVYRVSVLKIIACILVTIFFPAIVESLFVKSIFSLMNIDYLSIANIPLYRFISILIVYIFWLTFILSINYLRLNISKLQVLDRKKRRLLIFTTIFGIIIIGLQFYIVTTYVAYLPLFVTLINIITLLIYFCLSLYTTVTTSELESASTNLEEAQLYNKTLEILQDNTRAFRHDFSNIVQGMQGYIIKNDMDGLKKYYDQLVEDIQVTNNLTTLSPKVVNNPAIYNVLASKYHKADNLGIKIHLEAFMDLNELHCKIYEFTRVLGILMDNAIEASKECEEKIINVTFRNDTRKHMQLLVVENTYNNKDVDTEKIYEKGFSTKEGNSGLGLWEIRQILKKNNNLNLYTTKNDKFFSQQFEIYY